MYTDAQMDNLLDIGHEAEKYKDLWESALDNGDEKMIGIAYKIYQSYCEQYDKMSKYYYELNKAGRRN